MRYVTRNPFGRFTIRSERVRAVCCTWCGGQQIHLSRDGKTAWTYLLRFHCDGETARDSGPVAGGKLFCSRSCCESYIGHKLGE